MAEIEGVIGRHFQSPYVRGQIFLQIFVWFFVAESLSEWCWGLPPFVSPNNLKSRSHNIRLIKCNVKVHRSR